MLQLIKKKWFKICFSSFDSCLLLMAIKCLKWKSQPFSIYNEKKKVDFETILSVGVTAVFTVSSATAVINILIHTLYFVAWWM